MRLRSDDAHGLWIVQRANDWNMQGNSRGREVCIARATGGFANKSVDIWEVDNSEGGSD